VKSYLKRDELAGGVNDAVIGTIGLGEALAKDAHRRRIYARTGLGLRDLDDGTALPAGQVPRVGSTGGRAA